MELRPELLDKLKTLEIEAFQYDDYSGGVLTFRGPTWCVNPKTPLATYYDDFIQDEHGAMRDYAALPGSSLETFFADPDLLTRKAYPRDFDPIDSKTLTIHPSFKPMIGFNYFFGADLSVRGDSTGIALVYYNWIENKIYMPVNIRIVSESGERIDYAPIVQLIYNLVDRGFNIKKVAFDQFQSNSTILELSQHGVPAEQVNYNESFVGCTQLHELISTDKMIYYADQEEFIGEAQHLLVVNSRRIDHPSTGPWKNRKDCWDAAVNAAVCAIDDYYKNGSLAQDNMQQLNLTEKLLLQTDTRNHDIDDIRWIL